MDWKLPFLLVSIWFLCGIMARRVPSYELEDDFYTELRNILESQLSQKATQQLPHPEEVKEWGPSIHLGQVTGVALDKEENPVVFHRGSRTWEHGTFNSTHHFIGSGPIPEDTVVTLDKDTGQLIHSWGHAQFFLPHGIAIDKEGNVWLTDVALHQILKFPPGAEKPALVLGEAFVPGSDLGHFCKPTSVAVAIEGDFYVADGYCNARILHFDPQGDLIGTYGHEVAGTGATLESALFIPHGMALDEDLDVLCVADRENRRVTCIRAGLSKHDDFGQRLADIQEPNGARVFDVAMRNGFMVGIAGSEEEGGAVGFTASLPDSLIQDEWNPRQGFRNPHSIALSKDAGTIYVTETGPNRVWKLIMKPSTYHLDLNG